MNLIKNKKGIELSLNMIIIVILALAFLGIAIGLMVKWMNFEIPTPPTTCEIYPPDSSNPVCVNSMYEIKRGQGINMKVAFYNDEDNDITSDQIPNIICGKNVDGNSVSIQISSVGNTLQVGDATDYLIVVKIPKNAVRGTYPCNIKLSETEKSFALKII